MVKTHEISLSTSVFNKFTSRDYIILQTEGIEVNDYILFKQVEVVEGETKDTGLFRMTQVKEIITYEGLKDGYIMIVVTKL